MRYKSPRTVVATALLFSTIGMGLVGCSQPSASGSASSSSDLGECKAEAAKATEANLKRAEANPFPTEQVDGSKAKGKNFWFIGMTMSLSTIAQFADGAKAAAQAVGANVTVFDGKGTPATQSQGIQNAISAKADGIILGGFGASSISEAVKAAKAAGIPVVDGVNGLPELPLADGVAGQVSPSFPEAVKMQVNYALNLTGCDTNIITLAAGNLPSTRAYAETATAELTRLCPACKNTWLDVPAADMATKAAPHVQTALQRDPAVKVVLTPSDAYVPYIQQAITAVGSKAVILGHNGTQIASGQNGQSNLVADAVYAPPLTMGWFFIDAMLRVLDGGTYSSVVPEALLDKSNWGTSADPAALLPVYAGYENEFKKLWGVN